MVKPPVVYLAGLLRGIAARRRHRVLDVAVGHDAPAALLSPERRRAGRTTAGSTPARGAARWLTAVTRRARARAEDRTSRTSPTQPADAVQRAIDFWGAARRSRPPPGARLVAFAERVDARRRQAVQAARLLRPAPERAARAGRHLPRPAGGLMSHNCCNDFTTLAGAAARGGGRGRARSRRATRARRRPPGKGLDRRQFLLRSTGPGAVRSTGPSKLDIAALQEGVAAAAAPATASSCRSSCRAAIDSLSVLAPVGDPAYRQPAPQARARRLRRHAVHRGRPPALAPLRGRASRRCTPRARRRSCRPSATTIPTSRISTPATSTRWARCSRSSRRAGWAATSTASGRPDNPLQGLALSGDLAPGAGATAKMPVAAIDGPGRLRLLGARRVGRGEAWMIEAFQSIGDAHAGSRDAAMSDRRRRRGAVRAPAPAAAAVRREADPEPRRVSRRGQHRASRGGSRRSRRCSRAACRCKCVALNAPGDYDTHDSQPADLAENLKATATGCWRSSATSRRAGWRTAC